MKIVVAMDSFKDSLPSIEASARVRDGLLAAHPDWEHADCAPPGDEERAGPGSS